MLPGSPGPRKSGNLSKVTQLTAQIQLLTRNLKPSQLLRAPACAAVCSVSFSCRGETQIALKTACSSSHVLGPLAFSRGRTTEGLWQPSLSWQNTRCFLTNVHVSPAFRASFIQWALPPPSSNHLTVSRPDPRNEALVVQVGQFSFPPTTLRPMTK